VAIDVVHRRRRGWSELTVIADDAPGLLMKIAGALTAARVDVLAAQITSRSRGAKAEVIDVFVVRDRQGRALSEDRAALARVVSGIERVVSGLTTVEELVEPAIGERRARASLPARVTPAVKTEVEIDNAVATDFTVVDVYTLDRPGVLYTITRTLAALGYDIHLSKVATEASRVADVFYVRAPDGGKLDGAAADRLEKALTAALAELPP
jgi:[protein-PII] uridylyltransferase